jgi:hypothetical protein
MHAPGIFILLIEGKRCDQPGDPGRSHPVSLILPGEIFISQRSLIMKKSQKNPEMTLFHFKMDVILMDKLTDLPLFEKTESLSETIKRIMLELFPVIEMEDVAEKQRYSEYRLINDDKKIKRKHVFVQLPEFLYRRLKSLHDVLNYYSMAQLIRDLLWWYVGLVEEFGDDFSDELMRIVKEWTTISKSSEILVEYINQLLTFTGDIIEITTIFHNYSINFAPHRIFQLS